MTKTKKKGNKTNWQDVSAKIDAAKFREAQKSNHNQIKRIKPGRVVVLDIGIWNLEFVWDLVLGAWNFSLTSAQPSQLSPTRL